jgi:hypothetical protein
LRMPSFGIAFFWDCLLLGLPSFENAFYSVCLLPGGLLSVAFFLVAFSGCLLWSPSVHPRYLWPGYY